MNNLYVGREKDQSKKCILQNKKIILGEHKKNALKDISVYYIMYMYMYITKLLMKIRLL